jgi:EAL domain-containing protein (putative c-di-GMP-specific phosphodiesterase class I)/GGDEF domain-containing protein
MAKYFLAALELKSGVAIFLSILIVVIFVVAIFFLYRGIKRERHRYIGEKLKINDLDRAGYENMLDHKFRSANKHTHFSVMYIELQDAKGMKNAFGEKQYGDIIDTLSERFYNVFPKGTKICVLETDLIAAFIDEDLDKSSLSSLASFCLTEGCKPISLITKVKIEPDLNIGINSYNSFNTTVESFNQNLDYALAAAKRSGLNRYVIYSADLMDKESEEYKYYQEIKSAIEANEFTLYYQPIYNLVENTVCAYESLLRWNHHTLGVLAPNKFLQIMEQSGDINWVGIWAFEQLVSARARYVEKNPESGVVFTINLSLKQLLNNELCDEFRRILKKHRAAASDFCIEISEGAMFDKRNVVVENVQKLHQCGFLIAIDDFGLEMSSLKMLENITVDWVKLDRAFVEQSKEDFLMGGVVNTLVQFADKKRYKVIAEGIEDDVVLDYIKGVKIGYGQGYYFGKPLPPEEYGI